MERRSQPRFETNGPVRITVLGDQPRDCPGRIVNISGRGLRLLMEEPIPQGKLLKIETCDAVLLGEVCYCSPRGDRYALGVELEHALRCTEELARLADTLRGLLDPEDEPAPVRKTPRRIA